VTARTACVSFPGASVGRCCWVPGTAGGRAGGSGLQRPERQSPPHWQAMTASTPSTCRSTWQLAPAALLSGRRFGDRTRRGHALASCFGRERKGSRFFCVQEGSTESSAAADANAMRRGATAAACETRSSPALSCSPDADACPARGGSAPRGTGHAHNSPRASGQRYIVRTKCCVRPRDVIISRLSVPCPRAAGVEPQACRFLVRADLAVQRSIDGQRRRRARPLLREDVRRPRAQPIGRLSHGWHV
jgi:hypothetical protein